jgi:hypothetical protein
MVIDGKTTTGEEFACRIRPAAGPDWDSLRARSQRKNSLPSARGAVRGLPSCPRLSGSSALFRQSIEYGHRKLAQPQNMLV